MCGGGPSSRQEMKRIQEAVVPVFVTGTGTCVKTPAAGGTIPPTVRCPLENQCPPQNAK